MGMPELIAENRAALEERAIALAKNPARLAGLKEKLAAQRRSAPLFDTVRFTRALEAAFTQMQATASSRR